MIRGFNWFTVGFHQYWDGKRQNGDYYKEEEISRDKMETTTRKRNSLFFSFFSLFLYTSGVKLEPLYTHNIRNAYCAVRFTARISFIYRLKPVNSAKLLWGLSHAIDGSEGETHYLSTSFILRIGQIFILRIGKIFMLKKSIRGRKTHHSTTPIQFTASQVFCYNIN